MRDNEECFRVRGIPHAFDKPETEKHVRRALSLGADVKMRVRSLAPEPYPLGEQMATVDFNARPECLSRDNFTREWSVFCDCDICITNDSGCSFTIDSHFRDITVLHWPKDEEWKMDVIALPGLGGHAFGSFKSRGSTEMWLRDYIPWQLPGARIFTYGYDSHLVGSKSFQSVRDLAMKFRSAIERIRRHSQEFNTRKPIALIGHSFGGIILKEVSDAYSQSVISGAFLDESVSEPDQAILRMVDAEAQDVSILGSITGVLFFGVPNHGMEIKSLLPIVQDQPNEDLVRSLRQDSDLLIFQSEQFSKQFKGERQGVDFNKIKIFSFYETKTSPTAQMTDGIWKMDGPATVLVGKSSATHGRPWETTNNFVRPIDKPHSELVKFASRHDEDYRGVLDILQHLTSDEKNPSAKTQEECLCSLAFIEQDSRLQAILTTEDTSTWFAKHPSYQEWLNRNSQAALLSIVGNPGVGKSTLMKYAANHTKEQFDGRAIVVSHFFDGKTKESSISTESTFPNFAFLWRKAKGDMDLTRSPLGLYRNLLNQILSARPTLLSYRNPESIRSVFEKKKSTRGKPEEKWKWQEEELRGLLKVILTKAVLAEPVFVFIDALDECDNFNSAKGIVKYFSDLCTTTSRLHFCVSYRKHLDPVPANVTNIQICAEEEDGHEIAIRKVVGQILREIQDDKKRTKTQRAIINGAKRIFLWAILVSTKAVEMADAGDSTKDIEEMIRGVPNELNSLYKELLSKVDDSKLQQTIKLFQWICFAKRPLSLEELQFALAVDSDLGEMSVDELRKGSKFRENCDDVKRTVKALSKGLADIRHTDGKDTVQLIHQTVYLYLVQSGFDLLEASHCTNTPWGYSLRSSAFRRGHAQLARSCIACARMPLKDCAETFPEICLLQYDVKSLSSNHSRHDYFGMKLWDRQDWINIDHFGVKLPGRQEWTNIDQYVPLLAYAAFSTNYHVEMALGRIQGLNMIAHLSFFLFEFRSLAIIASWNRMFKLAMFGGVADGVSARLTDLLSVRICGNIHDSRCSTRYGMRVRWKLNTLPLRALHEVWFGVYRLTRSHMEDNSAICVVVVPPDPRVVFLICVFSYFVLIQVLSLPTLVNSCIEAFLHSESSFFRPHVLLISSVLIFSSSYLSFIAFYLFLYVFWWKISTNRPSSRLFVKLGEDHYCRTVILRSCCLILFNFLIVWGLREHVQFWDPEIIVSEKNSSVPLHIVFGAAAGILVLSTADSSPDEPYDAANGWPINTLFLIACGMVMCIIVKERIEE